MESIFLPKRTDGLRFCRKLNERSTGAAKLRWIALSHSSFSKENYFATSVGTSSATFPASRNTCLTVISAVLCLRRSPTFLCMLLVVHFEEGGGG